VRTFFFSFWTSEKNNLIGYYETVIRGLALFDYFIDCIFFLPGDKKDPVLGPVRKETVVIIGSIERNNGAWFKAESSGNGARSCFFAVVIRTNEGM